MPRLYLFSVLFFLAAFILLVLCSVSLPITKSLYFLNAEQSGRLLGQSLSGRLRLGLWGGCITTTFTGEDCTASRVGWDTDALLSKFSDSFRDLSDTVHALTIALILTPIAAGLTFIALLLTLIPRRGAAICAILVAILATLAAILATGLELGLFTIIRNKLNDISPGAASLGSGNWCVYIVKARINHLQTRANRLTVAALGCLFIGDFLLCCGGSLRKRHDYANRDSVVGGPEMGERSRTANGSTPIWSRFRRQPSPEVAKV